MADTPQKKRRADADRYVRKLKQRVCPEEFSAIVNGIIDDCHSEKIGEKTEARRLFCRYLVPYLMPPPEVTHKIEGELKHSGQIGCAIEIHALLANPEYVEYLRQRSIAEDCNTSDVRQICESGNGDAVENGTAHGEVGSGVDSDRDGSQ